MAIRDDHRTGLRNRSTQSSTLVPIAIGAVLAILIGWWLFTGMTYDNGETRTSAPRHQPNRHEQYEQFRHKQATVARRSEL